ncbi:hypothetical protein RJT34_20530 [Clitoria ternatea]|uniref:Uncharacterized protein n=1 Tax=Clitoria ternatea TaxID=43366 RepID=A0AAN9IT98_CLITE
MTSLKLTPPLVVPQSIIHIAAFPFESFPSPNTNIHTSTHQTNQPTSASWAFSYPFVLCLDLASNMLGKSFKHVPVTCDDEDHIPKGWLAIKVGQGSEQERIRVPVNYLNHPLFAQLLKQAEEEFGFAQKGTIIIPCQIAQFKNVQHLIHRERHHHHHHLVGCFGA